MTIGEGPDTVEVQPPRTLSAWQWAFDAAVAAVLTLYGIGAALHGGEYAESGPATALLVGVAGAAQALRRQRPTMAFAASALSLATLAVLVAPFQAGSSLLIVLVAAYSAMAYAARRAVVAVGAVALVLAESLPGRFGGPSSGAFVAVVLGLAGAAGLVVRRMRTLAATNAALLELVQRESELRTQAAVDDERGRISRELHDILSHSLAVVALQTGAAEHAWGRDDERALAAVGTARKTSLEAIEQLRILLRAARAAPDEGRAPLPDLDDLATLVSRTSSPEFPITFEVRGEARDVAPQVQASVYRAAQEGITNALKHAGTSGCRLVLTYRPSDVSLVVEDGGQGSGGLLPGSQVGLAGLRERAAILGGRIDAGPLAKGGWRLEAEFPG